MPYEDSPESAADALQGEGGGGEPAGEQGEGSSATFEIPAETVPHADTLKPGDEIIFKFVGAGDKGMLQVQYATEGGGESGSGQQTGSIMDDFPKE